MAPLHYVTTEFNDIDIQDILAETEQALLLASDNLSSDDSFSIKEELSSISEMQKELENDTHNKSIKSKKEKEEKKNISSPKALSQSVFGNWAQKSKPATSKQEQKKGKTQKKTTTSLAKASPQSVFGNWAQKSNSATSKQKDTKEKKAGTQKKTTASSKASSQSVFGNWAQSSSKTAKSKKADRKEKKLDTNKKTSASPKASSQSMFGSWVQKATHKKHKAEPKNPKTSAKPKHQSTVIKENVHKKLQQASHSATKAIQDGLESQELKNLQKKATQTIMDNIPKPSQKPLIDVSDRDIDISDVLAEAEAALLAAESTAEVDVVIPETLVKPIKGNEKKESSAKPPVIQKDGMKSKAKSSSPFSSFSTANESPKVDSKMREIVGEAKPLVSVSTAAEKKKKKPTPSKLKSKEDAKDHNLFGNFQMPKTPELIDVSDRDIDISDVMAEAEAALELAKSANEKLPSSGLASTKSVSTRQSKIEDGSMTDRMKITLKQWNEETAPIRKLNRANILYNLVQCMVVHKDFATTAIAQTALFLQLQNQRLSPIRKNNRFNMAHTTFQFAVLHKLFATETAQAAMQLAQTQNQKLRPIRRANRAALARTFVQSALLHKVLALDARNGIAHWARTQNAWMAPIRAENRQNLSHTLSRFLLLQRHLLLFTKAQVAAWWSLESKRSAANRGINYGILSHDMVEAVKVQKDIYQGLRGAPSKAKTVLSRVMAALKEQMEQEALPATAESVLESTF